MYLSYQNELASGVLSWYCGADAPAWGGTGAHQGVLLTQNHRTHHTEWIIGFGIIGIRMGMIGI